MSLCVYCIENPLFTGEEEVGEVLDIMDSWYITWIGEDYSREYIIFQMRLDRRDQLYYKLLDIEYSQEEQDKYEFICEVDHSLVCDDLEE